MIEQRDNLVIKDSMHNVPLSIIPDKFIIILVNQKSKYKLYFDQITPEIKEESLLNPSKSLLLRNDFYGRALVKS